MLITRFVDINITNMNITQYKKKFSNIDVHIGIITIPVELLSKGSHINVEVKCDNCEKILNMEWRSYLKYLKNQNIICCKSCNNTKVRNTMMKKYGVVSNSQLDSNKKSVSEKWKNKNSDELKNIDKKQKRTRLEKYGLENYYNTTKYKETCLMKYGVENVSQLSEIKEKVVKSKIKKFGCINNSQLKEFKEICRLTRIKNGFERCESDITKYERYRKDVRNKTRLIKSQLLENWNGCDFYDGEDIRDNFNLPNSHKDYPTVDHKKSVYYCFTNNVPVDECADITNLCLTKRWINSSKGKKNYL